ncbi:hypothetical protein FACS1894109_21210 [Spirochaetia bacterium]|nr:hypothetical protein FACS1894109_21210 [Spirochaetia bacterium]
MMSIVQSNKEAVLEQLKLGRIDGAQIGERNFVETIIKKMLEMGILDELSHVVKDKRTTGPFLADETGLIPMKLLFTLAITAKMKVKTSMTDIPVAIDDAELLSQLGYNLIKTSSGGTETLMTEGEYRYVFEKYTQEEFVKGYNECVQRCLLPKAEINCGIHLLDCTKIAVNFKNGNYEGSGVVKDDEGTKRGYKLSTLRGIAGDGGVIEEIRFGSIKEHDLSLSRDMILTSAVLKPGDILINDRGFLSREVMNKLKMERGVDTYVPLKKNMNAYDEAVRIAKMPETRWNNHPNKKRDTQKIAFVGDLGGMWESDDAKSDVPVNGCVVHDTKDGEYYVFITTDTTKTTSQIIKAYEMRPEIEEDYRQLKDFWRLEDFKSTKLNLIMFHILCALLGYLLFQIYVGTEEGRKYSGKSLPVILKNWKYEAQKENYPKSVIVYAGAYFGIFPFVEFLHIYASLDLALRAELDPILAFA